MLGEKRVGAPPLRAGLEGGLEIGRSRAGCLRPSVRTTDQVPPARPTRSGHRRRADPALLRTESSQGTTRQGVVQSSVHVPSVQHVEAQRAPRRVVRASPFLVSGSALASSSSLPP
eukprot:15431969-Alexandrium_andersonii.AAC.1